VTQAPDVLEEFWLLQVRCPAELDRWITVAIAETRELVARRGAIYYREFPCPCPLGRHERDAKNPSQVRIRRLDQLLPWERECVPDDLGWITEHFAGLWTQDA
jgi:hypothetical protein